MLKLRNQFNIQGALEFIREKCSKEFPMMKFAGKADPILLKLTKDSDFQEFVRKTFESKKVSTRYIYTTISSLWNMSSSPIYGRNEDHIFVREVDYTPNQCLALVLLFEYFDISFKYKKNDGTIVENHADIVFRPLEGEGDGKKEYLFYRSSSCMKFPCLTNF
jgi:hypothetical protein